MFGPAIKVIKTMDKFSAVAKRLEDLQKINVMVGVPEDESPRQGNATITNAQLAFLHERGYKAPKWAVMNAYQARYGNMKGKKRALKALNAYLMSKGSPWFNVPARPFLEPAIKANMPTILKIQKRILHTALDGKPVTAEVNALGLFAQSKVKGWFTDPRNNWAPNHPLIVKLKGSDRPLIDTAQLLNSIHYVVDRK
jgi:hypothetical protein